MEEANRELEDALTVGDPVRAYRADARFHRVYIEKSRNSYLINILNDLKIKYRRVEVTYFGGSTCARDSLEEHRAVLDAFRAGDPGRAQLMIRINWQNKSAAPQGDCAGIRRGGVRADIRSTFFCSGVLRWQSISTGSSNWQNNTNRRFPAFLRDMVAIPSESCEEGRVIQRIRQEMEAVGFDRIEVDPMGNLLGYIGNGKHLVAMDAHIDTVGIGNRDNWKCDPYTGFEDDEVICGRGTSDQEGGMASMVYAGKIIKDLGLDGDYTLLVTATVQEEDCDGLCWQYIIEEDKIRPEFVVSTEPTSLGIYRGQRGRMEIRVEVDGISSHGSAPERGDNAIFKMAPILQELQGLHTRLKDDPFLGKGLADRFGDLFHVAVPLCGGRRLRDFDRPALDRRRDLGRRAGRDPRSACGTAGRRTGQHVRLPAAVLHRAALPDRMLFPLLGAGRGACRLPHAGRFLPGAVQNGAGGGQVDLLDQRRVDHGALRNPLYRFRSGARGSGARSNEVTWKDELVKAAAMYAVVPAVYVDKYCG